MPFDFAGIYISLGTGLGYGLIISLLAAGMSLIYGVTNNVDTAHGSFYLLGALFAFVAADIFHTPAAAAIVVGLLVVFAIGGGVFGSRLIPKRMWVISNSEDQNVVLMILLGFAIIMEYLTFIVFGGVSVSIPSIFFGAISIGPIFLSYQYLFAIVVSILSYVFLLWLLYRSKLGKAIRAFSQDRQLAEAVGVNVDMIAILTFAIGCSLAAVTGTMLGSIYAITSASGWDELITAFIIVTFGGIGSIFGSLIAGVIYGIIYQLLQFYYPSLSFIITLLIIYVILILRPKGLFGEIIERA